MTNNTIPNVPRVMLADLLGNDHDKRIMAERHLLAMLANAPSPAGVDGLEVVAYIWSHEKGITVPTMRNKPPFWPGKGGYTSEPLCRLSDAQAIIDGLLGEVADLRSMLATVSQAGLRVRTERDQQTQRIGELSSHLEFAVTMLTVAGLAGNAQVEAMRAALSAGKDSD